MDNASKNIENLIEIWIFLRRKLRKYAVRAAEKKADQKLVEKAKKENHHYLFKKTVPNKGGVENHFQKAR